MAAFVEFIGVPGAGKSTVYREVTRRWRRVDNWVPVEVLLQAQPVFGTGALGALEKRLRSTTGRRLGFDRSEIRLAANRFVTAHPWFASATWSAIDKFPTPIERARRVEVRFDLATFWLDLCGRVQLAREREDCRICLIDEGLLHNNFLASALDTSTIAEATKAVPLMPAGVVHCVAPADVAMARQLHRGRTPPTYRGLSTDETLSKLHSSKQRVDLICSYLEAAGTPVLEINTEGALDTNARHVRTFLDTVHGKAG